MFNFRLITLYLFILFRISPLKAQTDCIF